MIVTLNKLVVIIILSEMLQVPSAVIQPPVSSEKRYQSQFMRMLHTYISVKFSTPNFQYPYL